MKDKHSDWDKISSIATFAATLISALAVILTYVQFQKSVEQNKQAIDLSSKQLEHQVKQDSINYRQQMSQLAQQHIEDSISSERRNIEFKKTIEIYRKQASILENQFKENQYINEPKLDNELEVIRSNFNPTHIQYTFKLTNTGNVPACNLNGFIYILYVNNKDTVVKRKVLLTEGNCVHPNKQTFYESDFLEVVDSADIKNNSDNHNKGVYFIIKLDYSRENSKNKHSISEYYYWEGINQNGDFQMSGFQQIRSWKRPIIDDIINNKLEHK